MFQYERSFSKNLFWKAHQWRYIATTIKIENLNSINIFDQEGSFRHSFFLLIVSMGVHRNNDQKKLRSLWEIFCHERSLLDKIVLKLVSMAVHRNDDQKKTVKIFNSFFLWKFICLEIYSENRISGGKQERWSKIGSLNFISDVSIWKIIFEKLILRSASVAVHSNDDQNWKLENNKFFWLGRIVYT